MTSRIGLLLLGILWIVQVPLVAQSDAALDDFGSAFLTALVKKDIEALRPLMVTEEDARSTMAKLEISQEEMDLELANFKEAYPRMQANFQNSFDYGMTFLEGQDFEKIAFVKLEKERPSRNPKVEKCDLLLYFNIDKAEYFIDIDDCVLTTNGWRLTAKFQVQKVEKE